MMKNLKGFAKMPIDILTKIYEYDDTYKEKMKDVFFQIWNNTWIHNIKFSVSNNKKIVYKYTYENLKIIYNEIYFFNKNIQLIFPHEIDVILFYGVYIGTGVYILYNNSLLFNGIIVNNNDYDEYYLTE